MINHWNYFKYVARHKWFVFQAGLSLGVPIWQLLIHDWTKFLPSEWFPYVDFFFTKRGGKVGAGTKGYIHSPGYDTAFDIAWNHHQKLNPHHWQFWVLIRDSDDPKYLPLPMPEKYIREMVADWIGAGRAQGTPDNMKWYAINKDKMILEENTRRRVEQLLKTAQDKGLIP
jgi:hypothetical protein